MEKLWVLQLLIAGNLAMDNLRVAYQWKQLDFDYPSMSDRESAIARKEFIPENNLPFGLEVYGDRLFITVPRWYSGVAASLTYINLSDSMDSPKLKPYPNWEAHNLKKNPEIISPFRIRADKCGRLWVLDTGEEDIQGNLISHRFTTLLIYDLESDKLLRKYEIPQDQMKNSSFFVNVAVEDHNCDDSYGYLSDTGAASIVVYSWKTGKSWHVSHHYFSIDPTAGNFNVSGISFPWTDAIVGLALSKPDSDGYSTLYFHPLVSNSEFSVNTKFLRNQSLVGNSFHEYKLLGNRAVKNGQSGASFLDQKTGVVFYSLINLNAVVCWNTSNPAYTMESLGRIYMSNVTMVFPSDIKVDSKNNLWVLSNRLPTFLYTKLDYNDINFRILTASVADAIRGTTCDSKLITPGKIKPTINKDKKNGAKLIRLDLILLTILFVLIRNL